VVGRGHRRADRGGGSMSVGGKGPGPPPPLPAGGRVPAGAAPPRPLRAIGRSVESGESTEPRRTVGRLPFVLVGLAGLTLAAQVSISLQLRSGLPLLIAILALAVAAVVTLA